MLPASTYSGSISGIMATRTTSTRAFFIPAGWMKSLTALRDLQDRLWPRATGFWPVTRWAETFPCASRLNAPQAGLDLSQVVAVCPVINPAHAMMAMEQGIRFYERYFERKWSRSLRIKQAGFS